jgi:hypothetical protein
MNTLKTKTLRQTLTTATLNFDTYKLVRQLERQGFSRGQSVALMRTMNAFLVDSTLSIKQLLITKTELENQEFTQKSLLRDLKTELHSLRQNESQSIKQESEFIAREMDQIDSKLSERILSLKSDISIDLNQHKQDTKEFTKQIDLSIQNIQHKLVIRLADMKTLIETIKVELTTDIVWMTVLTMAGIMAFDWFLGKPVKGSGFRGESEIDMDTGA